MTTMYPEFDFLKLEENSLEDLRGVRKLLREGLTAPSFGVMMRIVQTDLAVRINMIVRPSKDVATVLQGEFEKGRYEGLAQFANTLQGKLEELDAIIEAKEPV